MLNKNIKHKTRYKEEEEKTKKTQLAGYSINIKLKRV